MPLALRNGLIVVALAVVVWLVPGGGTGAGIVSRLLNIAFTALIVFILVRLYREHRMSIFGLGDRMRGLLYGCVAVIVFAFAVRVDLWETAGGTLLWVAIVAGAGYGLYSVWRYYRAWQI